MGCVSSTSDFSEQLRLADLRVTRPRLAVLEAVCAHPHADTETIFSAVRVGLPEVSRQAVYDVLAALTAARSDSADPTVRLGVSLRVTRR